MGWPEFIWRVFLAFVFNTSRTDVFTVATGAIAVWCVVAFAYVAYFEPPAYPIFFGCDPRKAHWYVKPLPWKFIFPAVLGGVLLIIAWPAFAQDTLPTDDIKPGDDVAATPSDLDPYFNPVVEKIGSYQVTFYDQRGGFAQVLPIYSSAPTEGIALYPDKLLAAPDDGVSGNTLWQQLGLLSFPADIRVDVYDGPNGKGYIVTFEARFNGQLWQRAFNSGPEKYRDANWQVVTEAGP